MAQEFSFDVVSKVDLQGVEDAVNTTNKEISVRYDFKGSIARVELDKKTAELRLVAEDDGRLRALTEVLQIRLIKRGTPIKNLEFKTPEDGESGSRKRTAAILQGLAGEKAKNIVAAIKKGGFKSTAAIQGDQVRVSSRSKDELQAIMGLLKAADFGQDLQFANYR